MVVDIAPTLEKGYFDKRYSNQQMFSQKGEGFAIVGHAEYKGQLGTLRANGGDIGGGSEILTVGALQSRDSRGIGTTIDDKIVVETDPKIANWKSGGGKMDDDKAASLQAGAEHSYQFLWHNRQQSGEVRVQDETTPTVSAGWGTGGNNVPFVGVRRLTPTECCRLQGFPDNWNDEQSDTVRYRQLGNAVAVPVVEWIGKRIVENAKINEEIGG